MCHDRDYTQIVNVIVVITIVGASFILTQNFFSCSSLLNKVYKKLLRLLASGNTYLCVLS